jgi:hypothetical protein
MVNVNHKFVDCLINFSSYTLDVIQSSDVHLFFDAVAFGESNLDRFTLLCSSILHNTNFKT